MAYKSRLVARSTAMNVFDIILFNDKSKAKIE